MRIKMLMVMLMVGLAGCGTTIYKMNLVCNMGTDELFSSLTALVVKEGMHIVHSDMKIGYLLAETNEDYVGLQYHTNQWQFTKNGNNIIATASTKIRSKNFVNGSDVFSLVYRNDEYDEDADWYWNVRNGLENLCGGKLRFEVGK